MESDIKNKKFMCHVCGASFVGNGSMQDHIESMHPATDDKVKCAECPKEYSGKRALLKHIWKSHNPNQQYQCEYCSKKFTQFREWIVHLRAHSEERNYKCDICPKAFKSKCHSNRHMRTVHHKTRSFVCDECGAAYTTKNHLKRHSYLHLKDKPFKCQFCGKECTQASNLKVHIMGVHKDLSHLVYEKKDSSMVVLPSISIPSSYKDYIKEKHLKEGTEARVKKKYIKKIKKEKPCKKKKRKVKITYKKKKKVEDDDHNSDEPFYEVPVEWSTNTLSTWKQKKTDCLSDQSPDDNKVKFESNNADDAVESNIDYVNKEPSLSETNSIAFNRGPDDKEIVIKDECKDILSWGAISVQCSNNKYSNYNLKMEDVKDVAVNKNMSQAKEAVSNKCCTTCNKKFATNKALNRHKCCGESQQIKEELSVNCCKVCNKKCKTPWELRIHLMVFHSTCARCNKRLFSPQTVFIHYMKKCCGDRDDMEDPYDYWSLSIDK